MAGSQSLTVRFKQEFDFRGMQVRLSISHTGPVTGTTDPEFVRAQEFEKEKPDTVFLVSTTVSSISINFSRPYTTNLSKEKVPTGAPPLISITLHLSAGAELAAKVRQ
jgi:hypothetical protein